MKVIRLFLLCTVVLTACTYLDTVKKFGAEFNTERARLGLRLLKSDAVLKNKHEDIFPIWINPMRQEKGNPRVPHWVSKQLEIRNGAIVMETEVYSSGREYQVLDKGMREEQLVIRYEFGKSKGGENPWWCSILWGPNQGEYSLEKAELILKEWGLTRL